MTYIVHKYSFFQTSLNKPPLSKCLRRLWQECQLSRFLQEPPGKIHHLQCPTPTLQQAATKLSKYAPIVQKAESLLAISLLCGIITPGTRPSDLPRDRYHYLLLIRLSAGRRPGTYPSYTCITILCSSSSFTLCLVSGLNL